MPDWRQTLHLEPPRGWLNDPNGLCYFGGLYHVFFQYCPTHANGSGPKHWGHYQSPDLLHWTFTGAPLHPDTPQDKSGAYSGCAVPCGDTVRLYYTGNVKHTGPYDYIRTGREANTILVETPDGIHISPKQVLLTSADYPADCSLHVRDPKVWREDGIWKMVLGARSLADAGRVLLYHSDDGLAWRLARVLEPHPAFGYMWECPDCFPLEGRTWLSISPQGLPHGETENQNIYQSGYFELPGGIESGTPGPFTEWDMGFDFYAPQTFEAPDGRRLLIGWMGMPDADYHNPTEALGWQHCLTIPREVTAGAHGLRQRPARELDALADGAPSTIRNGTATLPLPCRLQGVAEGDFSLTLAGGLHLERDSGSGLVSLRFTRDFLGSGRTIRRAKVGNEPLRLDILVDRSSLEIYLNDGETVFSTRFYPDEPQIPLVAEGLPLAVQPLRPMEFCGMQKED